MTRNFSTTVTAWLFLLAGGMLWLGWVLLPTQIGAFFQSGDFAAIHEHWRLWVWIFRVHVFGHLMALMALVALGALLTESEARILAWPGLAVAGAGLLVGALGDAFYYHHGAWGALEMAGKSQAALVAHVAALRIDTEYATCLVRFSRVFFGMGQLVLALALFKWNVLPKAIAGGAALLGLVAIVLIMGFPDDAEYYTPVFHLNALWLVSIGIVVGRVGLRLSLDETRKA
jgi:hypothetical protein